MDENNNGTIAKHNGAKPGPASRLDEHGPTLLARLEAGETQAEIRRWLASIGCEVSRSALNDWYTLNGSGQQPTLVSQVGKLTARVDDFASEHRRLADKLNVLAAEIGNARIEIRHASSTADTLSVKVEHLAQAVSAHHGILRRDALHLRIGTVVLLILLAAALTGGFVAGRHFSVAMPLAPAAASESSKPETSAIKIEQSSSSGRPAPETGFALRKRWPPPGPLLPASRWRTSSSWSRPTTGRVAGAVQASDTRPDAV